MMDQSSITAQRAREFGIPGQGADEADDAFKMRVSGALRQMDHPIEAHEAFQDALYDDPSHPMTLTGILGYTARTMQGHPESGDHQREVGHDIAAGVVAQTDDRDDLGYLALMMILMGR